MINVQLFNQTTTGAFNLCCRALRRLGFVTLDSDELNGWLCASKKINGEEQILFFDVQVRTSGRKRELFLRSNCLSDEANPIAESISEHQFLETLEDLLRMAPPDNPMKLSNSDYGLIAGLYT